MSGSVVNVSRRNFLAASGTFVLASALPSLARQSTPVDEFVPNLFVSISNSGQVSVTSHRSEMGQGVRTAIAQIVAEELDADWQHVRVTQAQGNPAYGDQNTDGSKSIRLFFDSLRTAGASARKMLIDAAAAKWEVEADTCTTNAGHVLHESSGRNVPYGQLVDAAASMPVPDEVQLKSRESWKFIGQPIPHVDAQEIASGRGNYGADVRMPNMAVAVIVRPPRLGASVDKAKLPETAQSDPGFVALEVINPMPGPRMFNPVGGVAVVATDTATAIRLSTELEVEWSTSPNDSFSSSDLESQLRESVQKSGTVLFEEGDCDDVLQSSDRQLSAVYETPFLSHAPLEPPAAIANVSTKSVEVWAPVQDPQSTRAQIAARLSRPPDEIHVTPTLLGGAFGRKSKPDFVLEAVDLSSRLKRPIRVQWTREDDLHHDYFHAPSAQFYHAALGDDGLPVGWLQRTAFPTIMSTFSPAANMPADWELDMGFTNTPYRCPNQRLESAPANSGVRIGWLRSVCNIFHAFGANVFVDELAHAAGRDPIAYRLAMWPEKGFLRSAGLPTPPEHRFDYGRLRNVLERVRDLSRWTDDRGPESALGVAVHRSFYSYVATVLEVRTRGSSYEVTNAYMSLDCGTYVNPDTCIAQMEGAVVFGLSLARKGKITIENGEVQESNFDTYPLIRMNDSPRVTVDLVDSTEAPAGVGEPGVPPVAPALSNALFALTGERHRSLPIA